MAKKMLPQKILDSIYQEAEKIHKENQEKNPNYLEDISWDWFLETQKVSCDYLPYHMPYIECEDGFKMSVQFAKKGLYSDIEYGCVESVEIGFPSKKEELIMNYAEDSSAPTLTVYSYVPIWTLAKVIEKHGCIKRFFTEKYW